MREGEIMASKGRRSMVSQRDMIRHNITAIIMSRGFKSIKQWCEMHRIPVKSLYNDSNGIRSGMSCKSLLKLCNELHVTPNDLLKGLY